MTALAPGYGTNRNAGPVVAFGDLLDLARCGRDTPEEICDACQTINLGHRRFCKGCQGKLPAFYVTGQAGASAATAARKARIQGRTVAALSGWVGTLLLVVVAAGSLSMMDFSPPDSAARVSDSLTAPAPLVAGDLAPSPGAEADEMEGSAAVPEFAFADEEDNENGDVEKARPSRKSASAMARRSARPAQASPRPAASAPTRLARCDALNFFSRAVCMNHECAQLPLSHSSTCVEARRQRRIDEARRNPTLVG